MNVSSWLGIGASSTQDAHSQQVAGNLLTSAAGDALHAAVSSMQTQKKEGAVRGTPLSTTDKRVMVQIDKIEGGDKPQLQVAPITVIKTELKLQFLRQIAVNGQYICYGLKQGHIRVLNKASALRALLKAEGPGGDPAVPGNLVADMAFVAPTSNLLASIDTSGLLTVRKIYEEGEEEGQSLEPAIQQEVLCRHSVGAILSVPCSRRLAWHPLQDSILAVTKGDRVCLVNVPPSSGVSGSPEFATPSSPSSSLFPSDPNACITSLAFHDRGDLLAASDNQGYIYCWSIQPDMMEGEGSNLLPLPSEPDIKFKAFDAREAVAVAVAAIDFLPSPSSSHGCSIKNNKKKAAAVLVVGNATCSTLRLWSVELEGPPQCLHTLELHGPTDSFFNHMIVHPCLNAVVLANTKSKQVYVAHVRAKGEARFDCFVDFSVTQPILSLTTIPEVSFEDGSEVFYLFTVQTEGIQQYTLPPFDLPEEEKVEEEQEEEEAVHDEEVEVEEEVVTHLAIHSKLPASDSGSSFTSPYRPLMADEGDDKGDSTFSPLSITGLHEAPSSNNLVKGDDQGGPTEGGGSSSPTPPTPPPPLPSPSLFSTFAASSSKAAASSSKALASSPSYPPPPSSLLVKKLSASASPNQVQTPPPPPLSPSNNIGAQMLMQQGWSPGTGLGKDRQGIVEPIAPVMRKQGSGLGFSSKKGKAAAPEDEGGVQLSEVTNQDKEAVDDDAALALGEGGGETEGDSSLVAPATLLSSDPISLRLVQSVQSLQVKNATMVNQLRGDMVKNAKATEQSIARAVEAALAKQSKQMEQERAKEAKKLLEAQDALLKRAVAEARKDAQEESARVLQQVLAGAVKDISSKINESAKNTLASIPSAVSRAVSDSLPLALASAPGQQALEKAMSNQLPRIVADAFKTSLVPAVEGAARQMFQQMEAALASGLAGHLESARASNREVAASVQNLVAEAKTSIQQMQAATAALLKQQAQVVASGVGGGGSGGASHRGVNVAELEKRSDPRTIIQGHLAQRKYGEAFTSALNTQDPSITLWLCRTLGQPSVVFDLDPIPMGQEIFLSLATHLAHDLGGGADDSSTMEFKLSWLQECVSAISPSDPKIGVHCKAVLEPIKLQLAAIARGGGGEIAKSAKTCLHLVNSIILVAGSGR